MFKKKPLKMNNLQMFSTFFILLAVAFLTLLERKIFGFSQKRKGPNKTIFFGFFQPFADASKLITKEWMNSNLFSILLYLFSAIFMFNLMLLLWSTYSFNFYTNMNLTILFIIMISSLNIYPLFAASWASNSKYSLIGAYRGIAQTISYEVNMSFLLMTLIIMVKSFSFMNLSMNSKQLFQMFYFLPLLPLLMFIFLAELNRTPFDFSESESELVSGYNTEFAGIFFTLFFLAEYGSILFMSFFASILIWNKFFFFFFFIFYIILIRTTLPRDRYDFFMMSAWKNFLPLILINLMIYFHNSL